MVRLAAGQGHAGAENSLGALYLAGQGVEQSTAQALRWYRLAAEQGYAIAQHNLGSIYITGRYIPQNFEVGAKWLRRAAEQGYANSMLPCCPIRGREWSTSRLRARPHVVQLSILHFPSAETDLRDTVAVEFRDKLAEKMTPDQIAEAQRLAREWKPTK